MATATFQVSSSQGAGGSAFMQGNGSVPGEQIPLTGSQTYTVDLAMMPPTGCKALVVSCDAVDANQSPIATPITAKVTINGNVYAIPVAPGGSVGFQNPSAFQFQGAVAAGSSGTNVNTFAGAGVLNVGSTAGFPATGSVYIPALGVTISYTGLAGGNSFTGCTTLNAGAGVLATGQALSSTGISALQLVSTANAVARVAAIG